MVPSKKMQLNIASRRKPGGDKIDHEDEGYPFFMLSTVPGMEEMFYR